VAAPTQGVLLHPAPHFVDDLGAQLHDMERIKDGDRVRELVADRVRVAPEGVEGSMLDPVDEGRVLLLQPAGVGGAGAARDDVGEPSV